MSKQLQRKARGRKAAPEPQQQQQEAAQPRDEQLDADVECCLADIDCCLAEAGEATAETELDRARREFSFIAIRYDGSDSSELRVWEARYAHLGLYYLVSCCTGPHPYGPDGEL